jgi:hypothetical protein
LPTVTVDDVIPVVSLNADAGMVDVLPEPPPDEDAAVVEAGCEFVDEHAVRVAASTSPAVATAAARRLPVVVVPPRRCFMVVSPDSWMHRKVVNPPPGMMRCVAL